MALFTEWLDVEVGDFPDGEPDPRPNLQALLAGDVHEYEGDVEPIIVDALLDVVEVFVVESVNDLVGQGLDDRRIPNDVKVLSEDHESEVK
eukprot:CAMPEP_0168622672 /NCGR_PEP_ID=MMETSP0449_2-20121227/8398_1 /TAXON_ID=1082188 /ORGANISM="Strombidium rassoulzadegani, Strain ras09" /LENGTH=90 /DNA_ID=CAMNT_0008663965 /DNA_START=46 /DNA_END=319 /DNA_ORIENTATION=-